MSRSKNGSESSEGYSTSQIVLFAIEMCIFLVVVLYFFNRDVEGANPLPSSTEQMVADKPEQQERVEKEKGLPPPPRANEPEVIPEPPVEPVESDESGKAPKPEEKKEPEPVPESSGSIYLKLGEDGEPVWQDGKPTEQSVPSCLVVVPFPNVNSATILWEQKGEMPVISLSHGTSYAVYLADAQGKESRPSQDGVQIPSDYTINFTPVNGGDDSAKVSILVKGDSKGPSKFTLTKAGDYNVSVTIKMGPMKLNNKYNPIRAE